MRETLGQSLLDEFLALAEVHRDGWGMASVRSGSLSAYVSTLSAHADAAIFRTLTALPIESAIIHERWASPGIGLSLDNQQPFSASGIAFAHNGTIHNEEGNIVQRPQSYRSLLGLENSTTMSDSRIYADLFFLQLAALRRDKAESSALTVEEIQHALAATIKLLRQDYPEASFNCLIETQDYTFAAELHAENPVCSEGLRSRYLELGWASRIDTYLDLVYSSITVADGSTATVVSSSGYAASDSWNRLGNNRLIALSRLDASMQIYSL